MLKSNLFEILKTLRKSELKRFEELIKSPYYNKNSNMIKLFKYVKKYYPEFNNDKLKKENVWKGIFKNRKFNYGIMKNLIYELNKLTEKFLELQEYEKNEFQSGLNLLNQLRQRNLNSRFEKLLKIYKDRFAKSKIGTNYYYYNHLIEETEQSYLYQFNKNKHNNYGNPENLNRHLFSYFFLTYFRLNHFQLMDSITYNLELSTKDLAAVLEFFEKNNFEKEPLTLLYYNAIKLVLNPQEEALYYESKRIFMKSLSKLDRITKYDTAIALTNYWIVQRMNGSRKFDVEQFEIVKLMLKNNFYIKDDSLYIDTYLFAHIITLANNLGHTSWCYEFINKYSDKLNPADKNNYYYFGMYLTNKTENKLEESLICLSKVKPKNVVEKITVKRLEIQVYYDLRYFTEIYSLIKNCKEYLKHDNASSELSKMGLNDLLYSIKKLVDINFNPDSEKYDKHYFELLKKEISEKQFISKSWVLSRLQELEKSAK